MSWKKSHYLVRDLSLDTPLSHSRIYDRDAFKELLPKGFLRACTIMRRGQEQGRMIENTAPLVWIYEHFI